MISKVLAKHATKELIESTQLTMGIGSNDLRHMTIGT